MEKRTRCLLEKFMNMKNNVKSSMNKLSSRSSGFLLWFAGLSFALLMIFKADYYASIFGVRWHLAFAVPMGGLVAFLAEGVRFSLMVASFYNIKHNQKISAALGFLGSIGMVLYDGYIAWKAGGVWGAQNEVYTGVLWFLIACGFLLEIRLCLVVSHTDENKESNDLGNGILTSIDTEKVLLELLKQSQGKK